MTLGLGIVVGLVLAVTGLFVAACVASTRR